MSVTDSQRAAGEAWARKTIEASDALDTPLYTSRFAEDVRLTLGTHPPIVGRETFRAWQGQQMGVIEGVTHEIISIDVQRTKTTLTGKVFHKFKGNPDTVESNVTYHWSKTPEEQEAHTMEVLGDFSKANAGAAESVKQEGLQPPNYC
ncbi:hypothetical protein BT69DRAFT_1361382 [Atractiella rhizophila]|nr:hypothetical protein BT69DRAFT_1361382 [Atractiella rhizophila]